MTFETDSNTHSPAEARDQGSPTAFGGTWGHALATTAQTSCVRNAAGSICLHSIPPYRLAFALIMAMNGQHPVSICAVLWRKRHKQNGKCSPIFPGEGPMLHVKKAVTKIYYGHRALTV